MAVQSPSLLVIRMYHSTVPSSTTKCAFEASGHISKIEKFGFPSRSKHGYQTTQFNVVAGMTTVMKVTIAMLP
jgi:hypothetical protein